MSTPAIIRPADEDLREWDARVDAAEDDGIRARWEYGRALLRRRVGKQLPAGLLDEEVAKTGKSRTELAYRMRFAERFATEDEVCNAVADFRSWHEVVNGALAGDRTPRVLPPPPALPEGLFSVVYCDPPWRYEHSETPQRRAVELVYPTLDLAEIKALSVPAADDAVLFLWATSPKLDWALEVIGAWGFRYRTNMVWVKDRIGMGYYVRAQHELLLIAKRGDFPAPSEADLPPSVLTAPRRSHSEKPDEFYEVIESLYPGYERVELFARSQREGWAAWGNEVA